MLAMLRRTAGLLSALILIAGVSSEAAFATPHGGAVDSGSARAGSARATAAAGDFTTSVDFASLVTRDLPGNRCEFRIAGVLAFTGTLEGVAEGTTTAVIFAPCADATAVPPGTYRDTFVFDGTFAGTVSGTAATGDLRYAGITRVGGSIDARIKLRANTAKATLHAVDTQVIVGGSYRGVAVVHD